MFADHCNLRHIRKVVENKVHPDSKTSEVQRPSNIVIGMLTASSSQKVIPINDEEPASKQENGHIDLEGVSSQIDDDHLLLTNRHSDHGEHHDPEVNFEAIHRSDSDEEEEEQKKADQDEDELKRRAMAEALKQSRLYKKLTKFYYWLTYENIKQFARWALESATCTISFTVRSRINPKLPQSLIYYIYY